MKKQSYIDFLQFSTDEIKRFNDPIRVSSNGDNSLRGRTITDINSRSRLELKNNRTSG